MASNDETIRLILETQGAQGLQDLIDKAGAAKVSLQGSYEVGEKAAQTYDLMGDAAEKAADDSVKAAVEQTQAQKVLNQILDETKAALETETAAKKGSGRAAIELSRFMQDFQAGGLMGVLNNVEGLTMALGGPAGLAGALTLIGVGIFALKPYFDTFIEQLGEAKTEIPAATNRVEQMAEAFAKQNKELSELREKQRLTADELDRYNRLTEEQIRLKDDLDNAKTAESVTADDTDEARRRASAFRKQVADMGGGAALVDNLSHLYDRATAEQLVANALRGREGDIDTIGKADKRFGVLWNSIYSPDVEDQRKQDREIAQAEEETRRVNEAREKERQQQAEREAARQRQADAETVRLREQANREAQRQQEADARQAAQEAREAPRRAQQARLNQFARGAQDVANAYGETLTPEMALEAAKHAVDAANQGVSADQAILGAVYQVISQAQQTQVAYQQLAAQASQAAMQMRSMPVASDTFFPGR